jgi:hypothetical protein
VIFLSSFSVTYNRSLELHLKPIKYRTHNQNTLLKRTWKVREDEEEEVISYWMTLKEREGIVI